MTEPRVSSLMWRQCVCGEWYWGAPQEGASDPVSEPHVWRTKTSIRDGSSTGRFVVDWEEAEEALDAARSEAATEARRELLAKVEGLPEDDWLRVAGIEYIAASAVMGIFEESQP